MGIEHIPRLGVTAATRSAKALVVLHLDESWRGARSPEIRAALLPLLDGPDPMYRLIASDALHGLAAEQDDQITELERRLALETDEHVATRLTYILGKYVHRRRLEAAGRRVQMDCAIRVARGRADRRAR